jgi:pimeloyl-ACP methyl ester carboxylesterase
LIIAGDDDVISHEHTLAMYRAIELGQLAIIPGTSHGAPKEKPGLFSAISSSIFNGFKLSDDQDADSAS